MSATFWNMRRRAAAKKREEKPPEPVAKTKEAAGKELKTDGKKE